MIFETERLVIRRLLINDLQPFFELESNPKVLQYATGEVKTRKECDVELKELIQKYDEPSNDFWIYAVERKSDNVFIGTLAFVKDDDGNDEIGYRFIEQFWGKGYATELCGAVIKYCKDIGIKKIVGYVAKANIASEKILVHYNFSKLKEFVCDESGLLEAKYELVL